MNFFSRVFGVISKSHLTSFLLILDEADIYLHPEWQRTFFDDMNKFFISFKKKNTNDLNINIFLTTHSPLMVSDLFQYSVFHVNERASKRIKPSNTLTYAANLYDLYKNEFIVKEPRGALASKNIKHLLRKSHKDTLTDKENNLLSRIGEPIIRLGLQNRFKLND